jgi:2-polyprenyl-3-methyl-5-hydroxy-6-metoxy-1,4-benzoquinol methylase
MKKIPRIKMIRRDDWLVEACRDKRVLHVGCTDSPITADKVANQQLLHFKLATVAEEIIGLDIDREGIETLSTLMPDCTFMVHSAEDLQSCSFLRKKRFDVIVAADVIEHMSNIGLFLAGAIELLEPEGKLLIATPQSFSIKRMIPMLFSGYEYVHFDHIAYFSVSTLSRLLSRYGLKISQLYMFQWYNPTFKNWLANTLLMPILWIFGGRLCDEIALEVQLVESDLVQKSSLETAVPTKTV